MADLAGKLLSSPTTAVIHANLVARIALERGDTTRARPLGLEGALATARRIGNRDELALTLIIRLARVALADRDAAGRAPLAGRGSTTVEDRRQDRRLSSASSGPRRTSPPGSSTAPATDAAAADRAYLELGDDEGRVDALVASAAASEAAGEPRLARRSRDLARVLDAAICARASPTSSSSRTAAAAAFLRVAAS